jgi:hypothetical protein
MNIYKILVGLEDYIGHEPEVEQSVFNQGVRTGQRRLLHNLKFKIVNDLQGVATLSELQDGIDTERRRQEDVRQRKIL